MKDEPRINLHHIHVITASLLEARDLDALQEYGKGFKTMNMNSETLDLARKLYFVRQKVLHDNGGSDDHFKD